MVDVAVEMKEILLAEKFALIFKNVNYEIIEEKGKEKNKKKILDNINAYCQSSELTAIMGPSGSYN